MKILTLAGKPDTQILELPGYWLVGAIGASLLVVLLLMAGVQVEIDPANGVDRLFAVVAGTALLARFALRPGSSNAQRIARDAIDHIGLFALVCLVGALASYPLAAHTSGFDDVALERADRLMHFDWLAWYAFVAAHPLLQLGESIAYQTIFVTPVILLGYFAVSGRRAEARMLIASFWLAALITLLLFTLTPAQGPLAYMWRGHIPYMPESALYQSELIPLLRLHEVHSIAVTSLHGLVCAPSFHTVSAVLYIVAAWPIRRLRWPVLLLNIAMLLATPVEGTHYLVDMLAGAVVAIAVSVFVRRGLPSLIATRRALPVDPLAIFLRRQRNGTLIQLLAQERSSGPRAMAILDEIDRRRLGD